MRRVRPIILCGGDGRRLWPLSTPDRPKPFHPLTDAQTLFQQTLSRLSGPDFLSPVVVCGADHRGLVEDQARAIGAPLHAVAVEDRPRGTLVATVLGLDAVGSDDIVLVTPADHVIDDPEALLSAIRAGRTRPDHIVLFGAPAKGAAPGLGHIVSAPDEELVRKVDAFIEKPPADRSARLIADGALWNMGLFLASAALLRAEIERAAPGLAHACAVGRPPDDVEPSLDRAVMEDSDRLAVASCDAGWRDVGCWAGLWDAGGHDKARNRLNGDATVIDGEGCLAWSSGPPVVVVGLDDVVVVSTNRGVLVMPRARAQEVGALDL